MGRGQAAGAGIRRRHDLLEIRGAGGAGFELAAERRDRHGAHERLQPAWHRRDRLHALGDGVPAGSCAEDRAHRAVIDVASMSERLRDFRRAVAGDVAADGPDAHQVAIDALVWGHAYVEAGRALRVWADGTADPLASEMAAAAEAEARGVLDGLGL